MTSPIPQCVYLAISPFAPSHQQRFLRGFSVRLVTPASPCIHNVYTGHLLRCLSRPQRSGCKVLLFRATAQCDCITDGLTESIEKCSGFATMKPVPECGHGSFPFDFSPVR